MGAPLRYPLCPLIATPLITPISVEFIPQISRPAIFSGSTGKKPMGSFTTGSGIMTVIIAKLLNERDKKDSLNEEICPFYERLFPVVIN
jgi:hypothetical protein